MIIEFREQQVVNTDALRRCYDGVHARSELRWTEWEAIEWGIAEDRVPSRLAFWVELNEYARKERGAPKWELRAVAS